MKPVMTWVLLADSRSARVVANAGPGKGFAPLKGGTWTVAPKKPFEDRQGFSHSSVGASQHRLAPRNTDSAGDVEFAREIVGKLGRHHQRKAFDRLIVVAEPHMLGLLRRQMDGPLATAIMAEVDKDLTQVPVEILPMHLKDVIAA